ncbi:glycosyltransferase [Anaeromyxobacter oryzisoli]|uniref:glycosyltransferase n=1 Tax=Anaeromyxobacter oryzisoli TaxID=2925408 RepID=UPI001F561308|nr:glycosyltransferase [Anaeromyxobacter sp. SG63]
MPKIVLIVPCYDEAARLDRAEFLRLVRARRDLGLLFVDDGSRDGTAEVIESMRALEARVALHRLEHNRGKAEAVRQGLAAALERGAEVVGYADADLATPVEELLRLVRSMEESGAAVVLGSRVRLLGTAVERRPWRHYLGRVFATVASLALRLPVYDTQCGAKLFRRTEALALAIAAPFRSRWVFDVELLDRLLSGSGSAPPLQASDFREVPLRAWRDARGSKLGIRAMVLAAIEIVGMLLRSRLRRRRAAVGTEPHLGDDVA